MDELSRARKALANADSIRQIKAIREKAEAIRVYAQQASLGIEIQNYAAELKLQAERLGGQKLADLRLRGGDRKSVPDSPPPRLRDLGVDKNQSARWQLEASVPEKMFGDLVRSLHLAGKEISSAALIRLAKQLREQPVVLPFRKGSQNLRVSCESHLIRVDWASPNSLMPDLAEVSATVVEVLNHQRLLRNIIESLCLRCSVPEYSSDSRALQRYLNESEVLLKSVARDLSRLELAMGNPLYSARRGV